MLDSLFRHSPPTALIVDAAKPFISARDHFARRGIVAPKHVSMICNDPDPVFEWCEPAITHFCWDSSTCVRRTAHGKEDRDRRFSKAVFVEGGTIGPVSRKIY